MPFGVRDCPDVFPKADTEEEALGNIKIAIEEFLDAVNSVTN